MDKIKKEEYKLALFAYLITAVLLFMAVYFPFIVVAIPFVLVFVTVKCGYYIGGAVSALSFVTLLFVSFEAACLFAAAFLPIVFAAAFVIRQKKRFRYSVLISCASALAGVAATIGMLQLFTGLSVVDYAVENIGSTLAMLDDIYVKSFYETIRAVDLVSGAITQAAIDTTSPAKAIIIIQDTIRESLNLNLVNMIMIYSLIAGFLYYIIPRAIIKKRKAQVIEIPPFSRWALPKRFWLAYIISYLFAIIGASYAWPSFEILEITIYNVYAFIFMAQGLSFLDYLYKTRKMSTGIRIILHITAAIVLGGILVWVGLFENAADMRKRMDARKAV